QNRPLIYPLKFAGVLVETDADIFNQGFLASSWYQLPRLGLKFSFYLLGECWRELIKLYDLPAFGHHNIFRINRRTRHRFPSASIDTDLFAFCAAFAACFTAVFTAARLFFVSCHSLFLLAGLMMTHPGCGWRSDEHTSELQSRE